nr:hypothetical protein [Bacteroidota bacterium]
MKKVVLLIFLGMIFTTKVDAKKVNGQIIYENDTIDVIIKLPVSLFSQKINYEKLQKKVQYYDSNGKKIKLLPDEAREIRFTYDGEDIRMLSRLNTLKNRNVFSSGTHIFLRLKNDGKLKLFEYHYTESNGPAINTESSGNTTVTGGTTYSIEKYILQKGNGELKKPRGIIFRKDMMEYFSDCPELSQKIEQRELKKRDLESIVRLYNSNCGR